jgi:hypothetical protein
VKSQPLFVSVFWLLAFLAGLGSSRAAEPKPGTLRTLTTAREAHTLTREEAASGYPVHLRAIVTYYDPYIDARHGILTPDTARCLFTMQAERYL